MGRAGFIVTNKMDHAKHEPDNTALGPFLEFLRSKCQSHLEHVTEAPREKRARVAMSEPPILIAQQNLSTSTSHNNVSKVTPRDAPVRVTDAGRYVTCKFDAANRKITLSSRKRSRNCNFKYTLCLGPDDINENLAVILDVATLSRDAEDVEGALWVTFDISFDTRPDADVLILQFALKWNPALRTLRNTVQRKLSQKVLDAFFPRSTQVEDSQERILTPQAFYEAAYIPDDTYVDLLSHKVPGLNAALYPFQRRTLQWLLGREGVRWNGKMEPLATESPPTLPLSFTTATDVTGAEIYVSDLYHVVSSDISPFQEAERGIKGGILAEEMGLGKTVEAISLILMHRRPPATGIIYDPFSEQEIQPTSATLIVTPASLKSQWVLEFNRHAPGLRVMTYEGLKSSKEDDTKMMARMGEADVVITTYNVLQAEIHFAEPPPNRDMRHERQYRRPKSPLIQLSWWRVCLDEAQQVESGVSNAAKFARLIPRINAWGITGTPVKENIKDLWGLLLFLRYEPFASSQLIWDRMTVAHRSLFKPLFSRIALRHTKAIVRNELELPAQNRYVITMPFTAIEEQNYQSQLQTLARTFGLGSDGAPLKDDWDPENPEIQDRMRRALAQLRQIVLHPELGPGRLLRAHSQKNRPLRTIDEVLDTMIDSSEAMVRTDQRTYLGSKLKRGQYLENSPRVREALKIWEDAYEEIKLMVVECRQQLKVELDKAKQAGIEDNFDEEASDDVQEEQDPEVEAVKARVGECQRRLRSALDLEHRAVFFIASAHFQIKTNEDMTKPDSEEFKSLEKLEIDGYERAKEIRKEILREALGKASSRMQEIEENAASQTFVEIPEIDNPSVHGLESRRILENLENLALTFNDQANLIDEWREQVIQILLRPLVDEEAEAEITGEEYLDSTQIQDDLMVFTMVLRAAVSDRQDGLSGLTNERTRYETSFAERQAKEGEGPAPEKLLELLKARETVRPSPVIGSYRSVISELRELVTKLRHDAENGSRRAHIELGIVQKQLETTQAQYNEQNKTSSALEKEIDRFTAAMNARVEYYRQLQAVSDTVATEERDESEDVNAALQKMSAEEQSLRSKIEAAQSKHRYLLHLKEMGDASNEQKPCIICQATFSLGVLTVCGHQFCKDCMMLWFKAHHNCPICKKKLNLSMLHDITLKKREMKVHQEQSHAEGHGDEASSPQKRRSSSTIYKQFSNRKLQAIKNIDLTGPSYATKIDTLIKHVLWLRQIDAGAKCVVFSQFRQFLDVLSRAFDRYRVGFASFDNRDGITKFKEDPAIECFLMDARAHASGLNLVNASHVFLCEPLLNTALELQAIARVDRIGQERETTVWLYVVEGTVEESIYNLSVKRRLEHMGRKRGPSPARGGGRGGDVDVDVDADADGDTDTAATDQQAAAPPDYVSDRNLEVANSMELQQTNLSKLMSKDRQLGEVVDRNDLWECLFGQSSSSSRNQGGGNGANSDDRFENPTVMRYLAGEAAAGRSRDQDHGRRGGEGGGIDTDMIL